MGCDSTLSIPNVTVHPSMASVPITVFLYNVANAVVVADFIFTSAGDGSLLLLRREEDMCILRD